MKNLTFNNIGTRSKITKSSTIHSQEDISLTKEEAIAEGTKTEAAEEDSSEEAEVATTINHSEEVVITTTSSSRATINNRTKANQRH